MNLDIGELTSSLSGYSSQANTLAASIEGAVRPIGIILIGLFMMFDMASWNQITKSQGSSFTSKMWIELSIKYLFALLLVMEAGLICDALVEIINMIIKVISKVVSTNQVQLEDTPRIKGFIEKLIVGMVSAGVNFVSNILLGFIVFMRYLDLYMLKAISPLLVAFFMMDALRSITINFLKYVAASAFIGVVLLVVSGVYDALVTSDMLKMASPDTSSWGLAFASIAKGIIYIITLVGTSRKARQLFGV